MSDNTSQKTPTLKELVASRAAIEALPDILPTRGQPQACSVINDLIANNKTGYDNLQTIIKGKIMESKDENISFSVNTPGIEIYEILCVIPMGGVKVVLFTDVDGGGWGKVFTGDEWGISAKRVFGTKSGRYVKTNKIIVDCKFDKDSKLWEICNITVEPDTDVSFGPNNRAISFAHLTAAFSNPGYMKDTLNKDGVSKCSFTTGDTDEEGKDEINVGKYSCSFIKNAIFPLSKYKLQLINKYDPACISADTKQGKLYNTLTKNIPEITNYIRGYDNYETGEHNIMLIVGEDDDDEEWATNESVWDNLFKTFGEICKTTI